MLCLIPNEKAGITVACSKLIDGLLAHLVLPVCRVPNLAPECDDFPVDDRLPVPRAALCQALRTVLKPPWDHVHRLSHDVWVIEEADLIGECLGSGPPAGQLFGVTFRDQ